MRILYSLRLYGKRKVIDIKNQSHKGLPGLENVFSLVHYLAWHDLIIVLVVMSVKTSLSNTSLIMDMKLSNGMRRFSEVNSILYVPKIVSGDL